MPGLATQLQGAPEWLQQYTQELISKSRQLAAEKYQPYGQVSSERNEILKREIERLVGISQQKNEFDIIPFSITGNSQPINISPHDLKNIAENESFARKIFESTTGYHNVSRSEIEGLRKRAARKLESESVYPDVRKILQQHPHTISPKGLIERDLNQLEGQKKPFLDELQRTEAQKNEIEEQFRKFEQQKKSISSQASELEHQKKPNIEQLSRVEGAQKELIAKLSQMNPYEEGGGGEERAGLQRLEQERVELVERLRKLDEEQQPLVSQIKEIEASESPMHENLRRLEGVKRENVERLMKLDAEQQPFITKIREIEASGHQEEPSIKRASIEREIKNLQRQRGTIAPMNEMHERAISMLERSFDDDTMKLASDELREAKKHSELRAVEPLVRSSLQGPSDEYMNKYIQDYTTDIRKALQDESEEQYIQQIAPKINMSFSQMGAFHSGARAKALRDSLSQHRLKLHRELAHLTGSARDKAMEHHELQKRREQSAAGIMEQATKSERDAAIQQAEALRQQAVTKQGLSELNVSALGQVARAKQEQEQHEIDAARQELARQALYPSEQLARESALLSGLPLPANQTIGGELQHASPQPPNLFTLGAGALGSFGAQFPQQQQQKAYKKGGSVRKNYDSGGHVGLNDIGNEMRGMIQEQRQNDKSHLEEASNYNPLQSWMRHVGNEMLTNPNEDPLLSLGRGTAASFNHRDVMKERAANLYDKIQSTRLNQYKVLAEFENMKENHAFRREKMNQENLLGREKLSESKRLHDIMSEMGKSKLNPEPANRKKSSTEQKLEDKALDNIIENHEMKNDLILMKDAIKNSTLGTGPWIGRGKSFLGIDNEIDVLGNHIVTKANKLYGRGAGSNLQLKTLQGGKPGQNLSPKANETIIKKYGEEADKRIRKNISILLKGGWSPEQIAGATGIEISNRSGDVEEPNNGDIIKMIDPNGKIRDVPQSDVEQALKLGAVRA